MTLLLFCAKVLALKAKSRKTNAASVLPQSAAMERMVSLENAQKKTLWLRIRENTLSFMESVKSGPDFPYIILVICYVFSEYVNRIYWTGDLFSSSRLNFFNYIVLLGSGVYLCYKAAMWKKLRNMPLLLVPVILAVGCLCGYFLMFLDQDWKNHKIVFTVIIDCFLCLMAYGKNFKKLLRFLLFVPITILLIAGLGLLAGFTQDFSKVGDQYSSTSLGIIYPNTWGYIAFQAMLAGWYVYLRKKPLLTFAMFWPIGVFMYFVIGCRTIAFLSLAFPMITLLTSWMEKREQRPEKLPRKKPGLISWFAIALPVLCCLGSVVLSLNKEWVAMTFYNTPLHSTAMRFVQGGLALDYFGFSLFGRPMRIATQIYLDKSTGVVEHLYVMDNAYISFMITKGVLWVACCLAWLIFGQWRGWKNRDYSMLLIASFMVFFAVMERPGMEVWYNFALLYPLASIAEPIIKRTAKKEKKSAE